MLEARNWFNGEIAVFGDSAAVSAELGRALCRTRASLREAGTVGANYGLLQCFKFLVFRKADVHQRLHYPDRLATDRRSHDPRLRSLDTARGQRRFRACR